MAKEKEATWSREKQQLQLERDNHTQLIKEMQNQLALSQQDTARVSQYYNTSLLSRANGCTVTNDMCSAIFPVANAYFCA